MIVVFTKKRGKNASFFSINPIAQDNKKNDEPDNVQKAHKSYESPKAVKKLESFAHQIYYWKDKLDGHSSNVCPDDRFFYEEILFLRKELDHKQKTIDNLLKIINHMNTNSNESGENIQKIKILSLYRLTQLLKNKEELM